VKNPSGKTAAKEVGLFMGEEGKGQCLEHHGALDVMDNGEEKKADGLPAFSLSSGNRQETGQTRQSPSIAVRKSRPTQ
jgi:hypothetical protein